MVRKNKELPYSQPIAVATLRGENRLVLEPNAEIRQRIARFAGLHAVNRFRAELVLTLRNDGQVIARGHLDADVEPICVLSLEPFADQVSEPIEATFAPPDIIEKLAERITAEDDGMGDEAGSPDLPDPIVNGAVDAAALAVEFLILGLDPYPRKPGVAFDSPADDAGTLSPFAALKALKTPEGER
jgi:uncharacterized metal-binding protein YceD (DUF177 family)